MAEDAVRDYNRRSMNALSQKAVDEYREIFKKDYGKELTDSEAHDGAQRLFNFFEVIYEMSLREAKRKKRLEKEPKGFHLEEDGKVYSCIVCHASISGKTGWWDLNGQKCLNCQRAVDKGVIPASVCKKRDSWYARWELASKFGIHSSTISRLIREGKLRAKNLTDESGAIYFQVFLTPENLHMKKLSHRG